MSATSAERSSLTASSAAATTAAILEAAEATHQQDGGWKRSTRRRNAKQFRRSTSCPSVALLAYLRTQRSALADAADDREQQRQPEENAVFLPSLPDPDLDVDVGHGGGPPQEALDWEREHKGEADLRMRLSHPQPQTFRIDIGDGLPSATSGHHVRRSTSAARAPGLHTHQRPASSDNRVWLVRHHPDEGHDYAEFALGETDDGGDHEREDDEGSEWMQVVREREQLERERADLFEVVRMWRDREEEHLTKEAKARRALKLLLQVNDNIEDDMRRRSYCVGGGPPQRSRAIINDMEAEERRGDRRLSLVVDVLTRMAREQLEGNLLGFIRNSIDNTTSGAGTGHNKKPFAYVGTGHVTSRYGHAHGASGHILDHSRFHYDREEELRKAKRLGAKLNHHHQQKHEYDQHQKKRPHQQRNRQAEAEAKELHDSRVGFRRARRFSTKQRYLEHLAATHYSGDDSDRRAVSMRHFKRPSLFAVVGGGHGAQPAGSMRNAAALRRERMDRVASVATFDRRGRVDLLASTNTDDDEGDDDADQLKEEQQAKKELSDAVDAIVAVADQLAADESVDGVAATPATVKKMMTSSSEAVQRRKLMKRCLTDEIMDILHDTDGSDGMDSSASPSGSVPRVRVSKSEEMTRPMASPRQRRNVIWRDNADDGDVDSNDSVDSPQPNLSTLAELAGRGSVKQRHPKAEARPSRRESAEERRSRKQLMKKRAKLQRREMKKLEKRAKKEEKKRARVWMREVKDLKRQLRLQKKKRNKDKDLHHQQPEDDVDSSSQEAAERLDEASTGKVGSSSGGGAKKHSHFFGKLRRKKDHTKKKNEDDDVDTKDKNEDDGEDEDEEESAVSPRQQRRRAFKSVSLRAMRKKESSTTTPDHSVPADGAAAAEETTSGSSSGGGGGRLASFWRKRSHGGSKKAKDAVQPQPQPQPHSQLQSQPQPQPQLQGAWKASSKVPTAENDENGTASSASARLPTHALLANSHQTGSSAVTITDHEGDNNNNHATVEGSGDRRQVDEDDEVEEEQVIEEDEDEDDEDELEEWERGKGKEVELQQHHLYEGEEEEEEEAEEAEELRVAEDKGKEKEQEQEEQERRPAAVPVVMQHSRQTEGEIRHSVAVQAMGQPLFGNSLARLIENQRLEEKMLGIPTLAVPRVLYVLCRALLQRSSGNMEGLFRVSGSSVEVQRLQEQLELRDYDVCAFDCYAIASCVEAWLSQLPEPIIPEEFYNDCVKNANRPDQSLLIIDRIPEINKCVVWCLCEFVRRITQPRQVIKTMMNAHNLAIVFAPSLLRCGDQAIMFYLSTFEVMFVQNLFQSYANLGVPLISLD